MKFTAIIFAATIISSLAAPAFAQNTPEQCAALDDGAERLICYDLIHRVERTEVQNSPEYEWQVRSDISRVDDSTTVYLELDSSDTFRNRFSGTGRGYMLIRCQENTTVVYFSMGDHHLADLQNYGQVTYRIDSAPAQSRRFVESTDNRALGLWNGGSSIPFIKQLFGGENLLIQITPFGGNAITVDFPIAGIEQAIEPLREACNW